MSFSKGSHFRASGGDIDELIRRGPIGLRDAFLIARQIAEALEAAHEQGIVHRDLKPANIKVRPDGTVKALDFGLAKIFAPAEAGAVTDTRPSGFSRDNSPTQTSPAMTRGVTLGTAAYMSPEQAQGRAVGKRSDVWSFGVVLYEILTGDQLFAAEAPSHTVAVVLADPAEIALTLSPLPKNHADSCA